MISQITHILYHVARLSNRARIVGKLISGNPRPLLRHERNRLYFRFFGRFLR